MKEQKLSSLRGSERLNIQIEHRQIYVGTHILLIACSAAPGRWHTCDEQTEINMFGDGELLLCVTTDGVHMTVQCNTETQKSNT